MNEDSEILSSCISNVQRKGFLVSLYKLLKLTLHYMLSANRTRTICVILQYCILFSCLSTIFRCVKIWICLYWITTLNTISWLDALVDLETFDFDCVYVCCSHSVTMLWLHHTHANFKLAGFMAWTCWVHDWQPIPDSFICKTCGFPEFSVTNRDKKKMARVGSTLHFTAKLFVYSVII